MLIDNVAMRTHAHGRHLMLRLDSALAREAALKSSDLRYFLKQKAQCIAFCCHHHWPHRLESEPPFPLLFEYFCLYCALSGRLLTKPFMLAIRKDSKNSFIVSPPVPLPAPYK